ncbi:hypothetical protein JCM14469_05300 [Desulfatiferula olefinivorans]
MLITPDFVFIFLPKTGTTFARDVLRRVFEKASYPYHIVSAATLESKYIPDFKKKITSDHGRVEQIPIEHAAKPIVSIIRNPFERLVSLYLFRAWERRPQVFHEERLLQKYPHFPDISFGEFVALACDWDIHRVRPPHIPPLLGPQSHQFIHFYFHDPESAIAGYDRIALSEPSWRQNMANVRFLRTESLRNDLVDFLTDFGFSASDLRMVLELESKQVSSGRTGSYHHYFSDETIAHTLDKEAMLFQLFPEYLEGQESLLLNG